MALRRFSYVKHPSLFMDKIPISRHSSAITIRFSVKKRKMKVTQYILSLALPCLASVSAFSPAFTQASKSVTFASNLQATVTETDDILKPKYEIEPMPLRIGHGFDIHRMAPIEEAGQPVVIGGVVITHKDQKVC